MDHLQFPSNEEIGAAFAQGEEQVLALFHHTVGELATRIQALESLVSIRSQALPRDIKITGEDLSGSAKLPGQDVKIASQMGEGRMKIHQGDVFWILLESPGGFEASYSHPHVVIQDNIFNHSRIHTVVVCALTSNKKRASLPGNVSLEWGEANLPMPSVVEVSKITTVDKTQLGDYIGSLSQERIDQILAGIRFLQKLAEPRD